jgi:hypothetical protein
VGKLNAKDIPVEPRGALGLLAAVSPVLSIILVPIFGSFQPSVTLLTPTHHTSAFSPNSRGQCIFLFWCVNNFLLLFQALVLRWAPFRRFLGLMPTVPDTLTALGKPQRPGVQGAILDRYDLIKWAWKRHQEDDARTRSELAQIYTLAPPTRTIRYETRRKEPADKRAKAAGAVESLK